VLPHPARASPKTMIKAKKLNMALFFNFFSP
jgi:hypothetical protein